MVRKFFDFLYKETSSLNHAAFLLGLFALLSQMLAFLRDRLLAHIFGASATLDVYYAAFRIPDFIFVTAASVVSLSVLIPFIVEEENRGRESLRHFINNIFSFFSLLIITVSVMAFFLIPTVSGILFKGFSAEALSQVVLLSRIMLLSPVILGFSNLFGSLTQAYGRFTIYAIAPLLYNAGIIIGIIFLAERLGILGVTIGVIVGAGLHALIQIPFVVKSGLLPKLIWTLDVALIKKVVTISLPRTLTLSMTHIATIFLVAMASLMSVGSISILSFSLNLQYVPLSIIGVSYSLAAFPTLSRRFRENNMQEFINQMSATARFIIFWSLPLAALLIVLRAQIVRVILGSGLFDWNDTRLTAAALALFAVSSVFQCLSLLFVRGFYSAGFTKKPFYINLFSTVLMIFGTWGLIKAFYISQELRHFLGLVLKVSDLPSIVVLMLPLGFSLAAVVSGLLHLAVFEGEFRGFSRGIGRTFFDCAITALIMGFVAYLGLNIFADVLDTTSLTGIFLQGALAGIVALAVGVLVLIGFKNKELAVIWNTVRERFWRTKIIATDPEIV